MDMTQIQLVPLSELAPGEVANIRNSLIRKVVAEAVAQLRIAESKIVVRDIRAKDDLDYTYEDWSEETGATANAYETMSTGNIADQRWIVFYGIKADANSMAASAIKFSSGGGERAIWQLQCLNEEDGMVGICPSGVVLPPNVPYTISRFVREINAGCFLLLKGFVVEPRGKVVSP